MNTLINSRLFYGSIFILLLLLSYSFEVNAQGKIRGVVNDVSGKGIPNANVLLLRPKDSMLLKGAITDPGGNYVLENIKVGEYLLSASFTGFQPAYTSPFNFAGQDSKSLGSLQLNALSNQLKTVTIQVKKPPFEQKIDRLVVNVQSSITSTGSSALDVLEKSPGIIVDRQNNGIIMGGKDGVVIMINGKINNMPASAVVQMLSGMSANNIEKIELITTPPASFDAEGNAGFINIVFKTNPDFGTNGSYTLTIGYARKENAATSINVNHRKGKFNLFGDYSFSRTHLIQDFEFHREVNFQNKIPGNS
ncbi:MAG: carboxypeptidase regulatory-like domain-containing protein, partial [Flavitalea sp.]